MSGVMYNIKLTGCDAGTRRAFRRAFFGYTQVVSKSKGYCYRYFRKGLIRSTPYINKYPAHKDKGSGFVRCIFPPDCEGFIDDALGRVPFVSEYGKKSVYVSDAAAELAAYRALSRTVIPVGIGYATLYTVLVNRLFVQFSSSFLNVLADELKYFVVTSWGLQYISTHNLVDVCKRIFTVADGEYDDVVNTLGSVS